MKPPPPPRLHVITALCCDSALVLRRGPSDTVATILWDRRRDRFEIGQWLKGRIYEHRCDLSPDGRHMIVFARRKDAGRAWTALSRAPWLRAIAVWPQSHTWHGGGAFDGDGRVWFNGAAPAEQALPDGLRLADVNAYPHGTDGFHMGELYAAMMRKRGWIRKSGRVYDATLAKPLDNGWHLELGFRLSARNRGGISNAYALVNDGRDIRLEQPQWEWAEPRGNLLQVASTGALRIVRLSSAGQLSDFRVIRDFTDMTFEPIEAPYEGVSTPEARP
jgi:hypothetical protein